MGKRLQDGILWYLLNGFGDPLTLQTQILCPKQTLQQLKGFAPKLSRITHEARRWEEVVNLLSGKWAAT